MQILFVLSLLPAADIPDQQLELLRKFRGEFVAIRPGEGSFPRSFSMGAAASSPAEQPMHAVSMLGTFAIGRYEVTQELWEIVMGHNPSRWKGPRNSVEMVSCDEAEEFCRRLTERMRQARLIEPAEQIRLPAEAEWEYAARAGSTSRYSFGDDPRALGAYAWFTGNAAGNDPAVGAKQSNPWGLYDVHGYVWEWCRDPWHDSYQGAPADSQVWDEGGDAARRVLRGGSWKDAADQLTCSFRRAAQRSLRDDAIGLRCVLAAP